MMTLPKASCFLACLFAAGQVLGAAASAESFRVGEKVLPLLGNYCISCHAADEHKGDVRLDNMETLALEARLDLLNKIQEQVYLKHMPPAKKRQPQDGERQQLLSWVSAELKLHKASKLEDKISKPEFGNYVEHEKLFSERV